MKEVKELHSLNDKEVPPFVIFLGEISQTKKAWVVVNDKSYEYNDAIKAIESCYKCCIALRTWSSLTDFLWLFFHVYVYDLSNSYLCKISYRAVNLFIDALKKFQC